MCWFASFAVAVGFVVLSVALVALARDGWRQTSAGEPQLTRLQAGRCQRVWA